MTRRHKHVVNRDELDWERRERGDAFAVDRLPLGAAANGRKLGCGLCRVPPGKRAWPMHCHYAIEEAIYILEGEGTLRIGDARVPVRGGDYIAMPPGPENAHQLINSGTADLIYLCASTMDDPDVVAYPDSDKLGVIAEFSSAESRQKPGLVKFFRADDNVNYWHGEDSEA